MWKRKTGEPGEKPSEQHENQQQTQPTYEAGSGNRLTRDTLVGGERSNHCAIGTDRPGTQMVSASLVKTKQMCYLLMRVTNHHHPFICVCAVLDR